MEWEWEWESELELEWESEWESELELKQSSWQKGPLFWDVNGIRYVSIPFTWNLPSVKMIVQSILWRRTKFKIGGPAIQLIPDFFLDCSNVELGNSYPNVLQMMNPNATRTTTGCIRKCKFCGIGTGKIENGGFKELNDWPDLPIICDNNLLASSQIHFDKVMNRLENHTGVDFNQGLDARKLTPYHAERFARLKSPIIRLACDHKNTIPKWEESLRILLSSGVKKSWIKTYCLIGFDSDPSESWERCEYIQKTINNFSSCLPMWYHSLDCLEWNKVTNEQEELGWTKKEQIKLLRRFYFGKYGAAL